MFEFINNDDERGQVGIGTLIVFIAMVLVAAIAAGVLINTAGFLQSQAEATGQESTDLVSERIEVTTEVGIVDNAAAGNLSEIRVGVTGAPGADQIDLSETTIQAVGPNGQANLVFNGTNSTGAALTSASEIQEGTFAVQENGNFVSSDNAVLNEDSQYTIVLNPKTIPFGTSTDAFGESDTSSLEIVSPASATTAIELNSPDLYKEDGEAVRL
ncbi:archaellin/type IV pilin N-terminal domain-containing protein [Halorubrum sp. HHNYT27]|uniref:archaellin/type IV pilin N-terminal domain-containing protein n=1 Tax=Halorubrum sp. HHNYT27 TaxID=3402275 RepID=UPI003EBB46DA